MTSHAFARYVRWMATHRPMRSSFVVASSMVVLVFAVDQGISWLWPSKDDYTPLTHIIMICVVISLVAGVCIVGGLWCWAAIRFWDSGRPTDERERTHQ